MPPFYLLSVSFSANQALRPGSQAPGSQAHPPPTPPVLHSSRRDGETLKWAAQTPDSPWCHVLLSDPLANKQMATLNNQVPGVQEQAQTSEPYITSP